MKSRFAIIIAFAATAAALCAQPRPAAARSNPEPAKGVAAQEPSTANRAGLVDRNFFAPELVMRHQAAIGLTADQQTAIRAEMQRVMAQFADLQWRESAESEALETLARQDRPSEEKVLAQLDKLLEVENQIKRLQTGMLVRIKNLLTPEQRAQLQQLARNAGPRPRALGDQRN